MISDFVWGIGPSAGHILATTCTSGDESEDSSGVHQLIHAETGETMCSLDIDDAGHAVTVNDTGEGFF